MAYAVLLLNKEVRGHHVKLLGAWDAAGEFLRHGWPRVAIVKVETGEILMVLARLPRRENA